jgi:hypothetical protein
VDGGVVELGVEYRSPPVFDGILNGRDGENEEEGGGVKAGVRGAEYAKCLRGVSSPKNGQKLTPRIMMKRK